MHQSTSPKPHRRSAEASLAFGVLLSVAIVAAGVTFFTSSLPDSFPSFWQSRILGWSVADSDADGFDSVASAGTDCTDQPYSVYMDGTAGCDSTAQPAFLESKSDPDTDDDIADHAWFQGVDDVYHLYFQNEDQGSGDDIEHYTSTDLTSVAYVGLAVQKNVSGWDSYGLWAPHIIQSGATYYMFYTGTTGAGSNPNAKQRIGVATSSDLTTWTKYPVNNCATTSGDGCVYECNETWTAWDDGGAYDAQCRDPMVLWDATNSRWLMFTTVRLTAATGATGVSGGISVATSTNLIDWTGLGYIAATRRRSAGEGGTFGQLAGTQSENPEVTYFDGSYYIFFTDWEDTEDAYTVENPRTQIQYASSPTLDIDNTGSANWTYRGYIPDPGVNAAEVETWFGDTWVMSQSIANANTQYYGTHGRDLQLKRIVWNDDFTFTTSKLTDFDCRVASSAINPDAAEVCNDLLDNNCSGAADEALYCGACVDADSDDYGSSGLYACPNATADCDDASSVTYPSATEICDSADNDCDGTADEAGACSTCTEGWSCGAWSACSISSIQTRTCTDANDCGTTATRPARIQACVPDPQDCAEAWTCSAWATCSNDTQTRTCTDANDCGTTVDRPALSQSCTVDASCTEDWTCSAWSVCADGTKTRTCTDANDCGTTADRPIRSRSCTPSDDTSTPPIVTETLQVPLIVAGAQAGGGPEVRLLTADGTLVRSFNAYDAGFRGGVNVAVGDIDGDGATDIVTAPGAGGGPQIRVFDVFGRSQGWDFQAYDAGFRGGVNVAVGDADRDGKDEIVTTPMVGGTPHVRIFGLRAGAIVPTTAAFLAYGSEFRGNVSVSMGDLDGDGMDEIITTPTSGGSPQVRVFGYRAGVYVPVILGAMAYDDDFRGGVITAAGDVNDDGREDILTGPFRGSPHVRIFSRNRDGAIDLLSPGFMVYHPDFAGGISIASCDLTGAAAAEIVTGVGSGDQSLVRIWNSDGGWEADEFLAFNPDFTGGVSLACGMF